MKNYRAIITIMLLTSLGCVKEFPSAVVEGCTDINSFNYSSDANSDDGSCFPVIVGCMDEAAFNYILPVGIDTIDVNTDDGSCVSDEDAGCTDESAFNYDSTALIDDGSCVPSVVGCIDELYLEYNPQANIDDGSCLTLLIVGCTDPQACNYNPNANVADDDSCGFPGDYYDCNGNCTNDSDGDDICDELEISGCTDENALNYNPNATDADNTCQYGLACYDNYYTNLGAGPWILDCTGTGCLPEAWIGNGNCNGGGSPFQIYTSSGALFLQIDGSTPYINVNCIEFDFDGGDCETSCESNEIVDCSGNCAPISWIGDGYCDDSTYEYPQGSGSGIFINFNCASFNYDEGDCDGGLVDPNPNYKNTHKASMPQRKLNRNIINKYSHNNIINK